MEEKLLAVYTSRAKLEGIPEDKLKGKSIQDLENIFSTLDILPKDRRNPVFDHGNGNGGGSTNTAVDVRSMIDRAKEKNKR
jgi:hypothetical protein